jgi:hypothetical protein
VTSGNEGFFLDRNTYTFTDGELRMYYRIAGIHQARIDVLNVIGRPVRKLIIRSVDEASGIAFWDGRDAIGARAASGLYLVVLRYDGKRIIRKVVVY